MKRQCIQTGTNMYSVEHRATVCPTSFKIKSKEIDKELTRNELIFIPTVKSNAITEQ